jgi:ABC-type sulfate transport system permease component
MTFTTAQRSRLRDLAWHVSFGGIAATLLLAVVSLVVIAAIFLGLDDFVYYLARPRTWASLWLTLWTASLSSLAAMALGIPVGYVLSRRGSRGSRLLSTVVDLPVMVPPAAVGVFLLGVFRSFPVGSACSLLGIDVDHAVPGVVVAQVTVTLAFAIRLVKASFDGVNPRFEAVSRSLGASLPRTFLRVSLPLARNGVLASLVVVWARAAAEWESLMIFVGGIQGRTDTLPFAVYLDWNGGLLGWALTTSLFSVLIAVGSLYAVRRLGGRARVF